MAHPVKHRGSGVVWRIEAQFGIDFEDELSKFQGPTWGSALRRFAKIVGVYAAAALVGTLLFLLTAAALAEPAGMYAVLISAYSLIVLAYLLFFQDRLIENGAKNSSHRAEF